ncbi:MAG: hypothetical protein HYT40_03510 [Candidatus Sungbacteria bacterium]|uniref:Prepilin-type N-terminal cleavage/methylation domain-containing protein n=1 Tax=Candidatus Sungiibacteriota bacterium TaxID=2750080 RepID=A0A931SEF9_9BACT|nr:hypothetical protein [Candidatus Sungbacteria bacterium]
MRNNFQFSIFNFQTYRAGGFGLVEIVVVAAMVSIAIVSFGEVARISLRLLQDEKNALEASFLLQEGLEGVRALRDQSWNANIANLANDTNYFLSVGVGSLWDLTATVQSNINGRYFRTIVFQAVNRNANDQISPSGTLDTGTRKVIVTVSWRSRNATSSRSAVGYLSNFLQN